MRCWLGVGITQSPILLQVVFDTMFNIFQDKKEPSAYRHEGIMLINTDDYWLRMINTLPSASMTSDMYSATYV